MVAKTFATRALESGISIYLLVHCMYVHMEQCIVVVEESDSFVIASRLYEVVNQQNRAWVVL